MNYFSGSIAGLESIKAAQNVCRDLFIGEDRVRNRKYIPQIDNIEDNTSYERRLETTPFVNMFASIVSGVVEVTLKKPPKVEGFKFFNFNDVDSKGTNFIAFIRSLLFEMILYGAAFVAIEGDSKRPLLRIISYRNLESFYEGESGPNDDFFLFNETFKKRKGYEIEEKERYVAYEKGVKKIWSNDSNNFKNPKFDAVIKYPNTDRLPIVMLKAGNEIDKNILYPKFYNIALLNVKLYNLKSYLMRIFRLSSSPIPVLNSTSGSLDVLTDSMPTEEGTIINEEDIPHFDMNGNQTNGHNKSFNLNSNGILILSDIQNEGFKYVECEGKAAKNLQEEERILKEDIDKLTFNILRQGNVGNTRISSAGDQIRTNTYMSTLAVELEQKINFLFGTIADMLGEKITDEDKIEFKKSFDDALFAKDNLKELTNLASLNLISLETLWESLKNLDLLNKDFDPKKERSLLEKDISLMSVMDDKDDV